MALKQKVQKVIGVRATEMLVKARKRMLWIRAFCKGNTNKIVFEDERSSRVYSVKNKNVFFGYYDLQQYNSNATRILAHVVDKNGNPREDAAELVWFDVSNGNMHKITKSQAWCWQQGSRLRWNPLDENEIIYNSIDNGKYVTKICNIYTKKDKVLSRALYDLDDTLSNGLSLNFARLQRLRPGYGYSAIADDTISDDAPSNDGIFHIDLNTGKETLLFSLADLAKDVCDDGMHYINHICVSPKGNKFTFFHIWTKGSDAPLKMRFYVSNMDGTGLLLLEDTVRISHYTWIDNEKMLATTANGKYIIYNVNNSEKEIIDSKYLCRDGHPSVVGSGFITDTYPIKKNSMQYVFRIGFSGERYKEILRLFADPRLYGEHRCDLHPRVTKLGYVTIDTTYKNGVRSVLAFNLKQDEM